MANTFKQLREKVLPGQLDRLKKAYEPLRNVDMSKHTDAIKQATAMLNRLKDSGTLRQLAANDIPVVSDVAKNLMKRRGITENWKDELKNQGNVRVGKTDSQGNWHSVSTSDKKELEKLKSQGYEVVKEADLSKAQIKMVHKQADELPKNDFIKRYGKDGDAVRYATATNQIKKKLGIDEGTWHIAKDMTKLKNTMKQPMPLGTGSFDFVAKYIGDDELWDDLGALKKNQDMVPAIKKAMKRLGVKEEVQLDEKKADFLRLNFADNQTVKKVDRWVYNNLGHANQGFTSMIPDEHGKSIEWEDIDDADALMTKLKRAGFSFTVDMREEVELTEKKWPLDMYQGDGADKLNPMVLKIRKMTDRNDHFGARIELAKIAGDKKLQTAYEGLEIAHITAANQAGNHAIILREKIGPYLRASIVRKFGNQKGPVYASRLMDAL
jgi:hypothetical protein